MVSRGKQVESEAIIIEGLFSESDRQYIVEAIWHGAPVLQPQEDRSHYGTALFRNRITFLNRSLSNAVQEFVLPTAQTIFNKRLTPVASLVSVYPVGGRGPLETTHETAPYQIDYVCYKDSSEPWELFISEGIAPRSLQQDNPHLIADEMSFVVNSVSEADAIIAENDWTICDLKQGEAVCSLGSRVWRYRPSKNHGIEYIMTFYFADHNMA